MNKIQLCDKYKCTQCMACVNTCPKNCIQMEDAGEGFCIPQIERNTCIECGACMKSCHMISHNVERQTPLKTLACWTKNDEDRKKSSSGGAFSVLAREVLSKSGVVFESIHPRDYEIDTWLNSYISSRGMTVSAKALSMLKEHVGMDLSRMAREIDKLVVSMAEGDKLITDSHIEQYIGISKEFNTFELNDAVLKQDMARAMRIADHFAHNPKSYPITLTINILFGLFQQLFLLNYLLWMQRKRGVALPGDVDLMREIRANNLYAVKELKANVSRWENRRVFNILGLLRTYDAKSKGIDNGGLDGGELLKELLLKIFTA